MKYRRRIYCSAKQRAEIWDRWQRGESMSSIGVVFDWQSSSVFSVISPTGGIRPAALEIDPAYVDLIVKRLESETGERVVHSDTGPGLVWPHQKSFGWRIRTGIGPVIYLWPVLQAERWPGLPKHRRSLQHWLSSGCEWRAQRR